jgi:hypothetical protein
MLAVDVSAAVTIKSSLGVQRAENYLHDVGVPDAVIERVLSGGPCRASFDRPEHPNYQLRGYINLKP